MTEHDSNMESQLTGEQILQAGRPFLEHFGVDVDPLEQPEAFRAALQQIDPRYQGGRDLVRFELEADQTQWDDETRDVIMGTAESMRLLEVETPLVGDHDVVIVLGGARQSNKDRTDYAVKAIKEGKATARRLVVAGSGRKLNEAEQLNTANYAPGAEIEYDLCAAAAAAAAKEAPGLITSQQYIADPKAGTPAVIESVLAALQASRSLPEGASVAAVTTQIYQTSTERDLARVAKRFGVAETFTAGNPSDPNIVAKRTPATYLSEVLRTLRAAVNDVEAERNTTPEQVRERVARIQAGISHATRQDRELRGMLDAIDRQNPQLSETITKPDGSVVVREVSGLEWTKYSSGISYSGPHDMVGFHDE